MCIEHLATELVSHIFFSCASISDVLALSSTCHRFRNIYCSSQKLSILQRAAETQFGPLQDLTQLLTHNASQPAHMVRSVAFSEALLKQMVRTGQIAERWCDVYPFKKWKYNYESRRLLTSEERYRVRRAIYRLWLYTLAFHNQEHPRETRVTKLVVQKRARLLHNWSTLELAEMADVHGVLREVVHSNVCPSNGTIARKFRKRCQENELPTLLFNIHLNYPPPSNPAPFESQYHAPHPTRSLLTTHYHSTPTFTNRYSRTKFASTPHHEPGAEGWGDDILHYYVVEDMLKLDPGQIMWLKENAPLKGQVEMYVKGLGDWFENNGETWGQTLEWVLDERGENVSEFLAAVADGEVGIAV
jgi:hypothetical protein